MRMTKEQLLVAARTAAKYLPAASADIMTELANRLDVTSVALSEALAQKGKLAADNSALKSVLSEILKPGEATLSREHRTTAVAAIETPATDAARASLRAEGVEMFAKAFREKADHATKNLWTGEAIAFEAQASMAEDFARQLREVNTGVEATSNGR
ncbi:hypothetical protein TUM17576_03770 [Enterobacter hormaechei]|nr:hypothetical protein [Enterobacter hormaechei]GJL33557.1 hypothetical protein TUM17576_03770 [Enterobacter hormaechei]